jgi:hypothetical protein
MSLDYIFISSSVPVDEIEDLISFKPNENNGEEFYKTLPPILFPNFNFSNDMGINKASNLFCEISPSEHGLSVYMRGDGEIVRVIEIASAIAAEKQIATIDMQSSEIFLPNLELNETYQDWYRKVMSSNGTENA